MTMAIPFAYNLRSARQRWRSSLVAMLGIAGTVGVFVAMLALARGFKATMAASGQPGNAIVQRGGADSEMMSIMTREDVRVVEDSPEVARRGPEPLVSAEVVVVAAFPLRETGTDTNVQVRGVSARALLVHDTVRVVEGRFFRPGLYELVAGRGAARAYRGVDLGSTLAFGGARWTVVGLFEAMQPSWTSQPVLDASRSPDE